MKVYQLIETLQMFDPELEVIVENTSDDPYAALLDISDVEEDAGRVVIEAE